MDRGSTERGEERGNRGKIGGSPGGHTRGGGELVEGSGVGADGFSGWRFGQGGDLVGGSPYPQGEEGLPGHRPRGGDVEGSGGDS